MTALRVMPDAEAIAIGYLVERGATFGRIYTRVPADPEFPLVTVALAPSQIVVEQPPLFAASLDVVAWALTKEEARDECAVAVAVLTERAFRGVHDLGVVTGSAERVGMQWQPDFDTGHARYLAQVVVYAHPLPE
jgi:hypothetical protein